MPRPRSALRAAVVGALVLAVGPLATPVAAEEPAVEAAVGATVVGEVVRVQAEPRSPEEATALHEAPLVYVEPARGPSVRLTGAEAEELPVGATVEVQVGNEVVDAAAGEGGIEPARDVLAAEVVAPPEEIPVAAASVPVTPRVTVAMVVPDSGPLPGAGDRSTDADTVAAVEALVEGPVAEFWRRESYGRIAIEVAPSDARNEWWSSSKPCSDWNGLWAEAAQHVGFEAGPGEHLLVYLPETAAVRATCEYGLGSIGHGIGHGGMAYVSDDETSVIAHELGHNFGLGHSSLVQCDRAVERRSGCGVFPYLDLYDVMGTSWQHIGSLSALHGRFIGVLPDQHVHRVQRSARTRDYVLSPLSARTGFAGIRVAGRSRVYWLEYRTATGRDQWLARDPDLRPGVLLRFEATRGGDTSRLLDGTPSARPWSEDLQTVLPAGRSYWLDGGAVHVTVKSTTATRAVVRVTTSAGAAVPRDLSGDAAADLLAVDAAGTLLNYRSSATGGFGTRTVPGRGWRSRDLVTAVGDWDGDDAHDVVARDRRNGDLWLYRGNDAGGFAAWRIIGRGWGGFSALWSPGDWNGDGANDLIARRRSDGALILYPGNGTGGFQPARRIGSGWNSMTGFAATGDWDANGFVDFVARRRDGVLFLYSGDGSGRFSGSPRVIGRGWQAFTALTGPGDWDRDGDSDLLVRRTDGTVWLYPGNGVGGFGASRRIGGGWGGLRIGS